MYVQVTQQDAAQLRGCRGASTIAGPAGYAACSACLAMECLRGQYSAVPVGMMQRPHQSVDVGAAVRCLDRLAADVARPGRVIVERIAVEAPAHERRPVLAAGQGPLAQARLTAGPSAGHQSR